MNLLQPTNAYLAVLGIFNRGQVCPLVVIVMRENTKLDLQGLNVRIVQQVNIQRSGMLKLLQRV